MAEEDLIFGKNRHLFGGIEPSNMRRFQALNTANGIAFRILFPEHTAVNGQTLCSVAGVVIRKSTDGYPKDEFSGTKLADIPFNGTQYSYGIIDSDIKSGVTYYYSAFPYTTQGVYNRNAAIEGSPNRTECSKSTVSYTYLYGFDLDLSDENPETRISYPEDVDNYDWGYVIANTNGANYGLTAIGSAEWLEHIKPGVDFTPRPCMLNYNGTVAEYLDPSNYTKNVNGAKSTLNTSGNSTSNAMMEWPKIYTKRWVENGVYKFRCSDIKIDDDWECWCNYDKNGNVIDHFYTAIYQLTTSTSNSDYTSNSKKSSYRSLCNCQYVYRYSDIATMRTLVREMNGDDWDIEQLCDRLLINDLLMLITKSTDIQSRLGNGITGNSRPTHSYNYAHSGSDIHMYGLFYGSTANYTSMVKIFGMLNWYGCRGRIVDGLQVYNEHDVYIKQNRCKSNVDYNDDRNKYTFIGTISLDGSYIKDVCVTDIGLIPIIGGGSSTTYFADMINVDYADSDEIESYEIYFGGHNGYTDAGGPFFMACKSTIGYNGSSSDVSTSLSCKPSKTT